MVIVRGKLRVLSIFVCVCLPPYFVSSVSVSLLSSISVYLCLSLSLSEDELFQKVTWFDDHAKAVDHGVILGIDQSE